MWLRGRLGVGVLSVISVKSVVFIFRTLITQIHTDIVSASGNVGTAKCVVLNALRFTLCVAAILIRYIRGSL